MITIQVRRPTVLRTNEGDWAWGATVGTAIARGVEALLSHGTGVLQVVTPVSIQIDEYHVRGNVRGFTTHVDTLGALSVHSDGTIITEALFGTPVSIAVIGLGAQWTGKIATTEIIER